ncbi:MAG: c-type cytochrome [Lentisphaerales bacterium]|nr:c-type cytochrome [Lentisphaerales bacterium]
MKVSYLLITSLFSLVNISLAELGTVNRDNIVKDPIPVHLEAKESMSQIEIPSGFELQLVASEPMVEEPVCMAWGPDGELYVAEMLTYMLDVDASREKEPLSRVVKLVDTDGDGKMDKRTVFLDKVVMPRAILVLDKKVVIGEPPNLWICEDTTGDGVADKKELLLDNFGKRSQNVEHCINGMQWTLDNWIYSSKTTSRFRYKDGKLIEGRVPFRGQWGHTTNNRGERFNTTNTVPVISDIVKSHYLQGSEFARKHSHIYSSVRQSKKYQTVYPVCGTVDTQGGRGINRQEEATLRVFTAVCGQTFFRGDRLGEELKDTYWACEPVGRLIRASKVEYKNGYNYVENIFEKEEVEFIASRDPLFRPVNAYTGPDGTLWFIDMYRGIIQQGNWTREGSYLRKEILRRGFEKFVGKGRIYRLVKKDVQPGKLPKLSSASTEELIAALGHPNGWWRDEAQKLLILRNKENTVALLEKNLNNKNEWARVHTIWTLEGLDAWSQNLALKMIKDPSEEVRLSTLRASDSLIEKSPAPFVEQLTKAADGDTIALTSQKLMTISLLKTRGNRVKQVLNALGVNHGKEVIAKSALIALNTSEAVILLKKLSQDKKFANVNHPLPQYLSLAIFTNAKAEEVEECMQLMASSEKPFAELLIKGLNIGNSYVGQKMRPVPLKMVKLTKKPASLPQILAKDFTEDELSSLKGCLTWPGDSKYSSGVNLRALNKKELALFEQGQNIYNSVCMGCHGADAKGVQIPGQKTTMAPPLVDSARVTDRNARPFASILLKGLTGPIDGKTYPGPMAAMGNNDDQWIAAIMTYVRRSFGNSAEPVNAAEVKKVRGWLKKRSEPFTIGELNVTPKKK